MAREGIYVNGKEITQRYVGNRLVWEKMKMLFSGNVSVTYDRYLREIGIGQVLSFKNIKAIEINGQRIAISSFRQHFGSTVLTFVGTPEEVERKTGFNLYRTYYGYMPVKIFGG